MLLAAFRRASNCARAYNHQEIWDILGDREKYDCLPASAQ